MAVLALMPSSSVALVVIRTSSHGIKHGVVVILGIVLGDLILLMLAMFGLSVLAQTAGVMFGLFRLLAAVYLIWLGVALLHGGVTVPGFQREPYTDGSLLASSLAGLFLTLSDVKALMFYASLLPVFLDMERLHGLDVFVLILITVVAVGGSKLLYVMFVSRIANTGDSPSPLNTVLRKTGGGVLVCCGGYLVLKG